MNNPQIILENDIESIQKEKTKNNFNLSNHCIKITNNISNNLNNVIKITKTSIFDRDKKQINKKSSVQSYQKAGLINLNPLNKTNNNIVNNLNLNIQLNNNLPISQQTNKKILVSNFKQENINKIKEENNDFIEFEEEKSLELNQDEKLIYGTREPRNYKKIKLLGKGGCGMVWLCKNSNNEFFAIKQIAKKLKNDLQSLHSINAKIGRREIELLNFITEKNYNSSNSNIIKLIDSLEDTNDIWLIFEKGGKSLSSLMFKIKGEFLGNERIYLIQKGKFLGHLFENIENFKFFFKHILNFINNINKHHLIHCDLKPENILIDYVYCEEEKKIYYKSFKIIDFGSAFHIENPENFASNTPEYMSPEITELIEKNASNKEVSNFLKNLKNWPWAIDIWSLGVMILEMLLCCPLWMNYKSKVTLRGKTIYRNGLFGVKGRDGNRIYNKQLEVANSIPKLLSFIIIEEQEEKDKLADLLMKMLDVNFKTRISADDALQHEFFN